MVGETFVAFKEQNIAVEEITKAVTDLGEVTAELTYIINGRAS